MTFRFRVIKMGVDFVQCRANKNHGSSPRSGFIREFSQRAPWELGRCWLNWGSLGCMGRCGVEIDEPRQSSVYCSIEVVVMGEMGGSCCV